MCAVANSPRHRKGDEGQNRRLKDKYHQKVRQKEDGGGRVDPIGVAITSQLKGEEITGRTARSVQARIGAGNIGRVRINARAIRVERRQTRGVGGMTIGRIET